MNKDSVELCMSAEAIGINTTLETVVVDGISQSAETMGGTMQNISPGAIKVIPKHGAVKKDIHNAPSRQVTSLDYPLDKVNSTIWKLLEGHDRAGEIGILSQKTGSGDKIPILYSIDFSKLDEFIAGSGGKITNKFTSYDKRVCIAAASLYNSGQDCFSFVTLYHAMGCTGNPSKDALNKMNMSLQVLNGALMTLSNEHEVEAGYKYPLEKYHGSFMPLEIGIQEIGGTIVKSAIHLFREPPIIKFARERGQFTTINIDLLQSPINKTDTALALEDYMINRIAWERRERNTRDKTIARLQRSKNRTDEDNKRLAKLQKDNKAKLRILSDTIYKLTGITEKKQKQRAKDTIMRLLEYYKTKGFIADFSSDTKGYSITLRQD